MIKAFVESFRFASLIILLAFLVAFIYLVWTYKWWILLASVAYVLTGMAYKKITGRTFKYLQD